MTTTDENTVQHHETDHRGAFAIHQDGQKMAEMTYSKAGTSRIIVDHTEVDEALRGQGAGLKMLQALVEWARTHNLKVMATCPFALAMFRKHPELRDVYDG